MTTLISQDFNSAGSPAAAGFTETTGTLAIGSSRLQTAAGGTSTRAYHTTDLGTADHWVEVDVVFDGTYAGGSYVGAQARVSTVAQTFYVLRLEGGASINLLRYVAGAATLVGSAYFDGGAEIFAGATIRLRLECIGSTINGYMNGTLRCTGTDTGVTTGTKAGVHFDFITPNATTIQMDNFAAGDFGSLPLCMESGMRLGMESGAGSLRL